MTKSKKPLKSQKSKSLCSGCRDAFYHHSDPMGLSGGNPECWSYKKMKVVYKKLVHVDDVPPWEHQQKRWVPSCYKPRKIVCIDPHRLY